MRPIRQQHEILPLIARPNDAPFNFAFLVSEGYDPGDVEKWVIEFQSRYGSTRLSWMAEDEASDLVTVTDQTVNVTVPLTTVSQVEDSETTLADLAALGSCAWSLTAYGAEDAFAWRIQEPVDFIDNFDLSADGSATLGSPITIRLGDDTTFTVTILGNTEGGGSVDNAAVNAAIAENAAASRGALDLGSAAEADAEDFEAAGSVDALASSVTTALSGKQTSDATLTALAALVTAANKLIYATGVDTFALTDFTAAARSFVGAVDAPAQRTALGLGTTDDVTFGGLSIPSTYNETQQNLIGSVWFGENGYGTQLRAYQTHFSFGNSIYANGMCLVGNYLGVEKLGVGAVFDPTVFFGSPSLGVGEINNGTTGQYRDLIARDLRTSQYLRPASFTVAAANALSSPPDGAIIYVSNEAGGARPAYQRSGWKVFADDSAIA